MRIKRMTAVFGALDWKELALGPGLTVIHAPNEGGKSTWAAFLRAMLYGVDTRERDRADFLADKNRYQPWSGAHMAGKMELEWEGREILLRRTANRSGPFSAFEAVYAATGDPVPGLTAANAGEKLVGAKKETYLRTAFVGQRDAAVAPSHELEARIANLAASGQEDVSFSAVERTLKDWRNRRRSNRANGLIPELEGELSETEQSLRDMGQARRRQAEAKEALDRLEKEKAGLEAGLAGWERHDKAELDRRYGQAMEEWQRAEAACAPLEPHPVFAAMTGEEAWAFARQRQAEREKLLEENRRRSARRAEAETQLSSGKRRLGLAALLAVCAAAFAALAVWMKNLWPSVVPALLAAFACVFCAYSGAARSHSARKALEGLSPLNVPEADDLLSQAAAWRESLARLENSRAAAAAAKRRAGDLYAQGARLPEGGGEVPAPESSRESLAARLGAVRQESAHWQRELARAEGALAQMGGAEELEARRDALERLLAARTEELEALNLALSAMNDANNALRERFSPALDRAAGEIFARFTGGRYAALSLARDFTAKATPEGDILPRPALGLSAGTVDQLYLAVRLALCQLTLPGAPIVLDDALCAFDDERMALALEELRSMGEQRQILLFSCHRREAAWAAAHGVEVIDMVRQNGPGDP